MADRTGVVLRPAQIPARQRGGGASTIPLVSQQVGSTEFLNGITIFGPGAAIPEHFHNCDESVMLLKGEAVAHIDGAAHRVGVGDTSFIPAGIHHNFENASDTDEMHIFWTYASVDATRTIVATGVTTRIDEEHGTSVHT
jgi:putative monooxygenase